MASSSNRKSGSSGRSTRKRVVIGAQETTRVRYTNNKPEVETERSRGTSPRRPKKDQRASRDSRARESARAVKTTRDERERRQRAIRVRRALVIGAALAVLALVGWALSAVANAPIFQVREVTVEGNTALSADEVLAAAQVPEDATLLKLSKSAIVSRVEADPWVEAASVSRKFPGTVVITVEERKAALVVDAGGSSLWLVSDDGVWLGERSAEATGLVTVRDVDNLEPEPGATVVVEEITNALALASELSEELLAEVRVISAPSVDKTVLLTRSDVEIYVGEAVRVAEKDRIAREILSREEGKVVYINVRVVDRPTWRGL
jgi:cell division protein FtsQ